MKYCTWCGRQIPAGAVAVLSRVIEQGSGPGIPQWRHDACDGEEPAVGETAVQRGIRRAP